MTQLEIHAPPRRDDTPAANLERVGDRIAAHVVAFCRDRMSRAERLGRSQVLEFRMADLTHWVRQRDEFLCAPDSPGRILRSLKKQGRVGYELLSRRDSLYRVEFVR